MARPEDPLDHYWSVEDPTRVLAPLGPGDHPTIANLQLVNRLPGGSGQSDVYLARYTDLPIRVPVVVKALKVDAADDVCLRFAREIDNARRVVSPSVARILDSGSTGGRAYMVQEFAQGLPLAERLQASPDHRLAAEDSRRLAVGLAEAVVDVHAAGVVHRDIKPSNVIIGERPVLVDFGISRYAEDQTLTKSNALIGTPRFMSPEQLRAEKVGPATDIFSWGLTVACAAGGRHPFNPNGDLSPEEQMAAVLHREPDLSGVPAGLRRPVLMALARTPGDRPTAPRLLDMLLNDRTLLRTRQAVIPLPPYTLSDWLSLRGARETRRRVRSDVERHLGDGRTGFLIACVTVVILGLLTADLIRLVLG